MLVVMVPVTEQKCKTYLFDSLIHSFAIRLITTSFALGSLVPDLQRSSLSKVCYEAYHNEICSELTVVGSAEKLAKQALL